MITNISQLYEAQAPEKSVEIIVRSNMNKNKKLLSFAKELLIPWFKIGKNLRHNDLKHYTGGDKLIEQWPIGCNSSGNLYGLTDEDKKFKIENVMTKSCSHNKKVIKHIGLEGITKQILLKGLELYKLTKRSKVNSKYFHDPEKKYESQRMDWHVWIDGKVVILEEDRAWLDKPFYTLKRNVVRAFMLLPYVKEKLHEDIVFIFHTLQRDVQDVTRNTRDMIDGYGEHIVEVNLSGFTRKAQKYNYFDNGILIDELEKYVNKLCEVFEKYEK